MERFVSLSVGTTGDEDHYRVFQDMSELAGNLGASHDYVSVTSSVVTADDDAVEEEKLYYDDKTLDKVRDALKLYGLADRTVSELIGNMQNAGILFRERLKTSGRWES